LQNSPVIFPTLYKRIQPTLLILYVLSLATSMGGMELFSSLLAVSFLLGGLKRNLPTLPFWKPLVGFVVVMATSIVLGEAPLEGKLYDLGRIRFFLLFPVLFYSLSDHDPEHRWLRWLSGITLLVAIYGFFQHFMPLDLFRPEGKKVYLYAIQSEKIGPLVTGTFNHHLTFANIYLLYGCLIGAMALSIPGVLHATLLFLVTFWTQSRAAWAAIPVCAFGLAVARGRRAALFLTLALLVVGPVFYLTDSGFRERLRRTVWVPDDHYDLSERTRIWNLNWERFKQSPILGVGWNNNERFCAREMKRLYPDRTDLFCGHAHSEVLQILATTGIAGLAFFLWLWGKVFIAALQAFRAYPPGTKKSMALGLLVGFVGFHIQGVTQWNFGDAEVLHNVLFFWAVIALLWARRPTVIIKTS